MWFKREQYSQWAEVDEKTPPLTRCVIATDWPKENPFHEGDIVLYLGEIPNMQGHIAFAGKDGKVYFGYHFENLHIIPDDE